MARAGWTAELAKRLHRAEPRARIIVQADVVTAADVIQRKDQWRKADDLTGLSTTDDGRLLLSPSTSVVLGYATGTDTRSQLNRTDPHVAAVEWNGSEPVSYALSQIKARLDPNVDGTGKVVDTWVMQLYSVERETVEGVQIAPICRPVKVVAGASAADVVFEFPAGQEPRPKAWGSPTVDPDVTTPRFAGSGPVTLVWIWAIDANGDPASNVAWIVNTAATEHTALGNTITSHILRSPETRNGGSPTYWRFGASTAVPRMEIVKQTYSAATAAFTIFPLDLGSVPAGAVRFSFEEETPGDASVTYEVLDDAGTAWASVASGQTTDELAGVGKRQTYAIRATLDPGSPANKTPAVHRMAVEEVSVVDFDGLAEISVTGWQIDPITLQGSICQAEISALRDGKRDYRDAATLLVSNHRLKDIAFRVVVGWRDTTGAVRGLHVDTFDVDDYRGTGAATVFTCLGRNGRLKAALPVWDSAASERARLSYENVAIKAAYDAILGDELVLNHRFRGADIEDMTPVTKHIVDSDVLTETGALARLAGGGITSSQGRIKFVTMHGAGGERVRAIFRREDISPGSIGPGLSARVPEFDVPWGYDFEGGDFANEAHLESASALLDFHPHQFDAPQRLDDEAAKWIDTLPLAQTVGARVIDTAGTGAILWPFEALYPHPHLEPGDLIAVEVDRFAGRAPGSDGRALRGQLFALGRLQRVGDVSGTQFVVWIQSYQDIVATAASGTRYGLTTPKIRSFELTFDESDDRLHAIAVAGAGSHSARFEFSDTEDFSANAASTDVATADGETATATHPVVEADRGKRWFGRIRGYSRPLSGGAVAGDPGGYVRDSTDVSATPGALTASVVFSAANEAIVQANAPAGTGGIYITVGVDADPLDPSSSSHDATIAGDSGRVNTGVVVPEKSVAHVKVRADSGAVELVVAKNTGAPSPVAEISVYKQSSAQTGIRYAGSDGTGGHSEAVEYQRRIDTGNEADTSTIEGAWSAWAALPAVETVDRLPFHAKWVYLRVRDADGNVSPEVSVQVPSRLLSIKRDTGRVYQLERGPTLDEPTANLFKRGVDTAGDIIEDADRSFIIPTYVDNLRRVNTVRRGTVDESPANLFKRGVDNADDVVETTDRSYIIPTYVDNLRRVNTVRRGTVDESPANLFKRGTDTLEDVLDGTTHRRTTISEADQATKPTQNLLGPDAPTDKEWTGISGGDRRPLTLDEVGLSVGDVVSLGGDVRGEGTGTDRIRARMRMVDSANSVIDYVDGDHQTGTNFKRSKRENYTIPAGTVTIRFDGVNSDNTHSAHLRRVMLNRGPVALPYEDPPFRSHRENADDVVESADRSYIIPTYVDNLRRVNTVRRGTTDESPDNLFKRGVDSADDVLESTGRKWAAESGAEKTTGKSLSILTDRIATNIDPTAGRTFIAPSYVDTGLRVTTLRRSTVDEVAENLFKRGSDTAADVVETAGQNFIHADNIDANRRVDAVKRGTATAEPTSNLFKRSVDGLSDVVGGPEAEAQANSKGQNLGPWSMGDEVASTASPVFGTRSFTPEEAGLKPGDVISAMAEVKTEAGVSGMRIRMTFIADSNQFHTSGPYTYSTTYVRLTVDNRTIPAGCTQIRVEALHENSNELGYIRHRVVSRGPRALPGWEEPPFRIRRERLEEVQGNLREGATQSDGVAQRIIAKGHVAGSGFKDTDSVIFPQAFQGPPMVLLRGGLSYSLDLGSGVNQVRQVTPNEPTAQGFKLHARVVSPDPNVAHHINAFDTGTLTLVGQAIQAAISPGDADNGDYDVDFRINLDSSGGSGQKIEVAIDTYNGSSWTTRALLTYVVGQGEVLNQDFRKRITVTSTVTAVRMALETVEKYGSAPQTASVDPHDVEYDVSASNDVTATPAGVSVDYEAMAVD